MNQSKIDTTYQSLVDIRVESIIALSDFFVSEIRYLEKLSFELPRVRTPPDLSITHFPYQKNVLLEFGTHVLCFLIFFLLSVSLFLPMLRISIKILYVLPLFVIIKKRFVV